MKRRDEETDFTRYHEGTKTWYLFLVSCSPLRLYFGSILWLLEVPLLRSRVSRAELGLKDAIPATHLQESSAGDLPIGYERSLASRSRAGKTPLELIPSFRYVPEMVVHTFRGAT